MNILVAGGAGTFLNNILIKLHKEGHKVSVLTGNRFVNKDDYAKCYELYRFPYDANCLNEIYESVAPDVTLFMGAFDTNFQWKNEESDSVRYSSSLANVLMGYAMRGKGRFIYLSSEEVFGDYYEDDIPETMYTSPSGFRPLALSQGEEMCENYRKNRNLDIITIRLDHLYGIPLKRGDVNELCGEMCIECLESRAIHYSKDATLSLLFENDALEALHRLIITENHMSDTYHLSSSTPITEEELAEKVRDYINPESELIAEANTEVKRRILSNHLYESEFGNPSFNEVDTIVRKIALLMKKKAYVYLTGEDSELPLFQRIKEKAGWFFRVVVPFLENIVFFLIAFVIYNRSAESQYFARLDVYLLYVLLFAMIYGQQQATVSALFAVAGYFFRQTYDRSGFDLLMDANTYVWVAQLFIVGLSVGYLRDQINKLRKENVEEMEYLETQLADIRDINNTNVRVKDVLETQVVNQSDSVGKIYQITSSLDQYSPEEVLFYAAETVGRLIKSNDVAIYLVSNADYARLFSSTSRKSRSLGNSIRYTEMGEMYETLCQNKVFINRKMDSRYPLMANAIYENEKMQMIIMVWGLSWENMTLGQANQLVIVSALIQNAVLRSNRYLAALEEKRYIAGTKMLEAESFRTLLAAFAKAETKGLTECTVLKVEATEATFEATASQVQSGLRQSDYYGTIGDGAIYAILANTNETDASFVLKRFGEKGLQCSIVEELSL